MAMPSTTSYQAGDLILVDFPFAGGRQVKTRPALVILDTGDADLVVARVTTQAVSSSHDVPIIDWQAAGLLAATKRQDFPTQRARRGPWPGPG